MIKINGTIIPTPSDYTISINDIVKADRNTQGDMIIDRIATKRKLELSWKYISKDDLATLLNLISAVFFTVEYPDPKDNALKTGTFYSGDRTAGMLDYKSSIPRWKDVKFNLIEK